MEALLQVSIKMDVNQIYSARAQEFYVKRSVRGENVHQVGSQIEWDWKGALSLFCDRLATSE